MNPSKCPVCDADLKVYEDSNEYGLIEASSDCPNKDYSWSYTHGYTEVGVGSNYLIFWDYLTSPSEQRKLISQINVLVSVERTKRKSTQLMGALNVNPDAGEYHGHPHSPQTIDLWGEAAAEVLAERHHLFERLR